jgi:hypothetical protein
MASLIKNMTTTLQRKIRHPQRCIPLVLSPRIVTCRNRLTNFSPCGRSIAGGGGNQLFRAGSDWLIYTAFINLICNKEITYGRNQ